MPAIDPTIRMQDIHIRRGDTFRYRPDPFLDAAGDPINLTSYTFLAQVRASADAEAPLVAITVTIIDATAGVLELSIPAGTTSSLDTVANALAVYDAQWTTGGGDVKTFLAGNAFLYGDVARA